MSNVCVQLALVATLCLSQRPPSLRAQTDTTFPWRGTELAAAVNLVQKGVKVEANLLLAPKVAHVRAVFVVINFGLGARAIYHDPEWLKVSEMLGLALLHVKLSNISLESKAAVWNDASLGGGEGLVTLLRRLAQESGHKELDNAPLVFWGHSAAGPFGATFALVYPQRTLAFVRYHSGARPLQADMTVLGQIPALIFVGGKDTVGTPATPEEFWRRGRSVGAPWTFAVEPDATHGTVEEAKQANDLLVPWLTAVLRQRLPTSGRGLSVVTDATAWVGNNQTGEIAASASVGRAGVDMSWLPDEASARSWRALVSTPKPQ